MTKHCTLKAQQTLTHSDLACGRITNTDGINKNSKTIGRTDAKRVTFESSELKQININGGYTIFSPLNDHIGKVIESTGNFYEYLMLERIKSLVFENSLVIDIGANIGNHTLFFAGENKCDVIAFEPVNCLSSSIEKTLIANQLHSKVKLIKKGVGRKKQKIKISTPDQFNLGMFSRHCKKNLIVEEISIIRLDRFLHTNKQVKKISLIKLDVEGMEGEVLRGARQCILKDKPILAIEILNKIHFYKIKKNLKRIGYKHTGTFNATPTHLFEYIADQEGVLK